MKAKLIKTEVNYILEDDKGVVIASTSLNKEGLSLSLKNCQAIERGYDLDELADNYGFRVPYDGTKDFYDLDAIKHYKAGFQKALELMGDKKFSASQLLNAMDLVWQWINCEDYGCKTLTEVQDKHIQSLQQTEWDVEVEMICPHPMDTYRCGLQYGCDEDGCNHPNQVPYLDAEGCLILKRID